ncbi:unnamed protein product [Microthlaspi erraticum]|uniref:Uncharacterized protein n=1 Tax=Microthlaspi erraticum TaxID=1685480 RepID=A0A6D2IXY3_9BRAS|nr:unnamed protein product [Microthlaspi erraticum]
MGGRASVAGGGVRALIFKPPFSSISLLWLHFIRLLARRHHTWSKQKPEIRRPSDQKPSDFDRFARILANV